MALLFQEAIEGIQLGKESDKCFMCEREARSRRETVQEGELTRKEIFLLNLSGLRHCLCMKHFKTLLGDYALVTKEEYESTHELLGSLLSDDDVIEVDAEIIENGTEEEVTAHIEEKVEEKKDATKTAKAAKPSKGK